MTDPGDAAAIRVVAGSPTDEETAAIAALFTQLLIERDLADPPLPAERARSGWGLGARPVLPRWSPDDAWGDG